MPYVDLIQYRLNDNVRAFSTVKVKKQYGFLKGKFCKKTLLFQNI